MILKSHRVRLTVTVAAAVAAVNVALWWAAPLEVGASLLGWGSLMLWLAAYPAWRFLMKLDEGIPYLPAMAAIYFVSYGLPAFRGQAVVRLLYVRGEEVLQALRLAALGLL